MPDQTPPNQSQTTINTQGGSYAGRDTNVGRDYAGRDINNFSVTVGDTTYEIAVSDLADCIAKLGYTPEKLSNFFYWSLPYDAISEPYLNLEDGLVALSQYRDTKGKFSQPLLKFLIFVLKDAYKTKRSLYDETKNRLNELVPGFISYFRRYKHTVKIESNYLLVDIKESQCHDGQYHVTVYLGKSDTRAEHNKVCGTYTKDNLSLSAIAQYIYQLKTEEQLDPKSIEIFLPVSLLAEYSDVDQWEYNESEDDDLYKLVHKHHVVVRVRERQFERLWNTGKDSNWWTKKWKHLCSQPLAGDIEQHLIRSSFKREIIKAWTTRSSKVLTIFPEKPADFESLMRKLAKANVPAILWHRECFQNSELAPSWIRSLAGILPSCNPQNGLNLLTIIHEIRTADETMTNKSHMGNHLTLIWENPNRMLPDTRLNEEEEEW